MHTGKQPQTHNTKSTRRFYNGRKHEPELAHSRPHDNGDKRSRGRTESLGGHRDAFCFGLRHPEARNSSGLEFPRADPEPGDTTPKQAGLAHDSFIIHGWSSAATDTSTINRQTSSRAFGSHSCVPYKKTFLGFTGLSFIRNEITFCPHAPSFHTHCTGVTPVLSPKLTREQVEVELRRSGCRY